MQRLPLKSTVSALDVVDALPLDQLGIDIDIIRSGQQRSGLLPVGAEEPLDPSVQLWATRLDLDVPQPGSSTPLWHSEEF